MHLWTVSSEFKAFFSLEGRFGTLLAKWETQHSSRYNPVVKGKRLVQVAHCYNPYSKREREYQHNPYGKKGYSRWARPRQMTGRQYLTSTDPHPVGRDPHLLGHQPTCQGEQASVKETSHTQGKQPVHQGCMIITKSNMVLTA